MICARTRLTSMICFSLEKKYRGRRAFDEKVHMNNHRMGARGNATTFPLPWQELLTQLQETEKEDGNRAAVDLPRTGEELSNFVSVLLKTSDEGDTKESLARFVHQAIVRRDVVIRLIEEMHLCGHRSYSTLDMHRVRQKANESLPRNGVPEHVAKLLPYDSLLDNIQVQKQATPVSARTRLEEVSEQFRIQRPNAVVLEAVTAMLTLTPSASLRCVIFLLCWERTYKKNLKRKMKTMVVITMWSRTKTANSRERN